MNVETVFVLLLAALTAGLVSIAFLSSAAPGLSRVPVDPAARTADDPVRTACELPSAVEAGGSGVPAGIPLLDKKVHSPLKTATFAMG